MATTHRKNAAGAGTIRQKQVIRNGKTYTYWEARATIGYNPSTGRQIQRSVSGKTQKEVAAKLRQMTAELDQNTYRAPSRITLEQWLTTWSAEYLNGVKPSTILLYKDYIRLYIVPALGAAKLESLDTTMIQRFYNRLVKDRGPDLSPLSPKTVKNIHGVLHKALQQAVAVGYLRINPTDACSIPKVTKKEITPLTEEQISDFLAAIRDHKHQVLYTVALFTGMREGELLGLMWNCVDFENNTILVDKQLRRAQEKGGAYYFSAPKNNKSRTITVAPSVIKLLKIHKAQQTARRRFVGPGWVDSSLVFTNEIGDRLSARTVYDCFKRIVAKIGCPTVRFHDLRHTYAVMSLESGDDIKTVQENLGHHAAAFTLDVYGHVSERMRKQSADRMEQVIQRYQKKPCSIV